MDRQLRDIFGDDQFEAERREGRRLTLAIANDVIAYHTALKDAGIGGTLLDDLTRHFSTHWLGDEALGEVGIAIFGEDD